MRIVLYVLLVILGGSVEIALGVMVAVLFEKMHK